MVPAEEVATCVPSDTIKTACDAMLQKKIGAVVILDDDTTTEFHKPVGIVTKTDLVAAYQKGMTLDSPIGEIMSTNLDTVNVNQSRDQAAHAFDNNKNHHALVINTNGKFMGIISAWDIAAEAARDDKAFPWQNLRAKDGKFHKPTMSSPRSVDDAPQQQRVSHIGDSFRDYVDHLDLIYYD
jgi:CBS domain-containing protein